MLRYEAGKKLLTEIEMDQLIFLLGIRIKEHLG